jgi:hypothetical protein
MKKLLVGIVMFSVLFITPVVVITSSTYIMHIIFGLNLVSTYVASMALAMMATMAGIRLFERIIGV